MQLRCLSITLIIKNASNRVLHNANVLPESVGYEFFFNVDIGHSLYGLERVTYCCHSLRFLFSLQTGHFIAAKSNLG